jgi:hypothetical protein
MANFPSGALKLQLARLANPGVDRYLQIIADLSAKDKRFFMILKLLNLLANASRPSNTSITTTDLMARLPE